MLGPLDLVLILVKERGSVGLEVGNLTPCKC